MNRFVTLPILLLIVATMAGGTDSGPSSSAWEQSSQFRRNRELITELVDSSLVLAREDDPLKRAEQCHGVAMQLGAALRQAADSHDGARMAELSQYYRDLVSRGVAGNLSAADRQIPVGSAREEELVQLRDKLLAGTQPLEEDLGRAVKENASSRELRSALRAVSDGRKEVQGSLRVLRAQPRADDK
jgi:hypothetical protein